MKRDMDLVREILITLGDSDNSIQAGTFVDDRNDFQVVAYHFDIMQQAGLVEGTTKKGFSGDYLYAEVSRLTWEGNEFLDSVQNNKVWMHVKAEIAKSAIGAPFEVVKNLAISACNDLLGGL